MKTATAVILTAAIMLSIGFYAGYNAGKVEIYESYNSWAQAKLPLEMGEQ